MFLVPRVFGLFGLLSDAHVFCKQIPVSQGLSWPRWPDQKARRMWRGDCFVLRNERRTTNQLTGSVGMVKKRKNENFDTAISLPDFVLFPLLTFMLSYVQKDAHTPNIVGPTCCELLRLFARR